MKIHVIGPRDRNAYPGVLTINTASHSPHDWSQGLSPFVLGPVPLYGTHHAQIMECGWQFSKVYAQHLDHDGNVTPAYWRWARNGWASRSPVRYPMGKGAKPAFLLWEGERLGYIEARKRVYLQLYRDAVREQPAFRRLAKLAASEEIALWDFDGYDHESLGMSLADVLDDPDRICGHAFVLKMMLLYGPTVTPEEVRARESSARTLPRPAPAQAALF